MSLWHFLFLLSFHSSSPLAFLYNFVLSLRVSLTRSDHETCIDDFPLVHYQPLPFHLSVELVKQLVECTILRQQVLKLPNCFCIRHIIHAFYADEPTETCSVFYLIFNLLVSKPILPLQNQHFEHHYGVDWRSACITFPFFGQYNVLKNIPKYLKINMFFQNL